MRIGRCVDTAGRTQWVAAQADGGAELLRGESPFTGLQPTGSAVDVSQWLVPIQPTEIFGIGLNYRAHAVETGAPIPSSPVMFMKPRTAVADPGAAIRLPVACEHGPEVDYEAELAVVIGRTARDVAVEDALGHVFGYTCANDVSARRWQKHAGGGQWTRGKSFDTFCPLGPFIVTSDEIPDPQSLPIQSVLNGRTMQQSNTADMIFTVAELIAFISRDTTLLPGTVILTGTPEGVGFTRQPPVFLGDGDTIEIEIDGIGKLRNPVQQARSAADG
ncbi:MAG: fumarylacetoacetate hydrolase family protein [Chromatiaceae bacterium]|nr:fumarylacetoacetate hydrolase family protein [Chromatiaceae bacterium]